MLNMAIGGMVGKAWGILVRPLTHKPLLGIERAQELIGREH